MARATKKSALTADPSRPLRSVATTRNPRARRFVADAMSMRGAIEASLGARSKLSVPLFGSDRVVPVTTKPFPFESDCALGIAGYRLADFVFPFVDPRTD